MPPERRPTTGSAMRRPASDPRPRTRSGAHGGGDGAAMSPGLGARMLSMLGVVAAPAAQASTTSASNASPSLLAAARAQRVVRERNRLQVQAEGLQPTSAAAAEGRQTRSGAPLKPVPAPTASGCPPSTPEARASRARAARAPTAQLPQPTAAAASGITAPQPATNGQNLGAQHVGLGGGSLGPHPAAPNQGRTARTSVAPAATAGSSTGAGAAAPVLQPFGAPNAQEPFGHPADGVGVGGVALAGGHGAAANGLLNARMPPPTGLFGGGVPLAMAPATHLQFGASAPLSQGAGYLAAAVGAPAGQQGFGGYASAATGSVGPALAYAEHGACIAPAGNTAAGDGAQGAVGARARPTGTLIDALSAAGGSLTELIVPFGAIDLVQLADVELYDLEELKEQLSLQAGFSLSATMYKRLKRMLREHGVAASKAQAREEARQVAATAAKATRKGKAPAAAASGGVAGAAAAALAVGDAQVLMPGDDSSDEDMPPTRAGSSLPAWARLPRLEMLLSHPGSIFSLTELMSLLVSILKMAKHEPFDANSGEVTAEQVEHNVLAEMCDPELEVEAFVPAAEGPRGVRLHVRELLGTQATAVNRAAEKERAAAAEAKAKADAAERARLLQRLPGGTTKARSLEHQRAHERIAAVVENEGALEMISKLQASIKKANGETAFLDLKAEGEAQFVELANLLHHEDIPLPQGTSQSSESLSACLGGHVGDTAAFVAVAAVDVQMHFVKAVTRAKLNKSSLDSFDNERLAKAAHFGRLTATGSATGQFKLSELTNPGDTTSIVSGKDKRVEARRLLDRMQPVSAALAAAHPRDRTVYDTLGHVHRRCLPEDGSETLSPEVVDAVYGTFLRTYADMWSQFQTSLIELPTCEAAWEAAQGTTNVKDAWQREQQRDLADCKKKLAERDAEIKQMKTQISAIDARLKRVEQKPAREPSGTTREQPGEGGKKLVLNPRSSQEVNNLKNDAWRARCAQRDAEQKADTAKAAKAADADELAKAATEAKKVAAAATQAHENAKADNAAAQAKGQSK